MKQLKHMLWAALIPAPALASTPPNIIYIMTDQQSATAMSCAGDPYLHTPNMDRLAARGVRFENAYCTQPLSGPSRAAMFTGLVPGSAGLSVNGKPLTEEQKAGSLGIRMRDAGYECAYAGKWHVHTGNIPDQEFGFDSIYAHNDYGLAEECVAFLNRKHTKPFFLVASFDNPHNICEYARNMNLPFATIEQPADVKDCPGLPANFAIHPYDAEMVALGRTQSYRVHPTQNYTPDDWRRYRYTYYRLVETVDKEIGKIVDAMDANKLWDNTVVIFTSDHGDGNGAHQWNQKTALYDEVTNIPLITYYPRQKKAGTVLPQVVNNGTDFMATVLDIAGANPADATSGVSFLNLMKNPDAKTVHQPYVVCETLFYDESSRGWMVRTADYKYMLYDKGRYREQLYDMNNDRGEMRNLAIETDSQEVLKQHRAMLQEWMTKHNIAPVRPGLNHVPGY